MTSIRQSIIRKFENFELDSLYAEFIMRHSDETRIVCNGDMLVVAMEDGYMAEEFIDYMVKNEENKKD